MFVRAKTLKGKKYAYLVQNIWKKKKVTQIVKKYLGKIISINNECIKEPKSAKTYDWDAPVKLIIREIIVDEFERKGFIRKNWRLIKDDLIINLSTCKITESDKNVVLFVNGRYLYGKLLDFLQNFYEEEEEFGTKGEKLAKSFSDSGINIEKDVFIELYKKIYL